MEIYVQAAPTNEIPCVVFWCVSNHRMCRHCVCVHLFIIISRTWVILVFGLDIVIEGVHRVTRFVWLTSKAACAGSFLTHFLCEFSWGKKIKSVSTCKLQKLFEISWFVWVFPLKKLHQTSTKPTDSNKKTHANQLNSDNFCSLPVIAPLLTYYLLLSQKEE